MILTRITVGPLEVNCYVVADERTREAAVIDPGDDIDAILKIVRDEQAAVKFIINTHGHFDHVGANAGLKTATGAQVLIHEADAELLGDAADQGAIFGMSMTAPPSPDRYVQDGETLRVGDLALTILHTPGHSRGGISVFVNGAVFTGDALFAGSIGRTDFPGGDLMTLITSIRKKLLTLPEETKVFPGHGPESTIGDELRENPFLNEESGFA
jgi:glyoxylase-like metal-dependent hydrolase (beta-lactamase superfamily II)